MVFLFLKTFQDVGKRNVEMDIFDRFQNLLEIVLKLIKYERKRKKNEKEKTKYVNQNNNTNYILNTSNIFKRTVRPT